MRYLCSEYRRRSLANILTFTPVLSAMKALALILTWLLIASASRLPRDYPYPFSDDYARHRIQARQQYFRSADGTYSFSYDTGSVDPQSFRSETRDARGVVRGYYGYVDPNGILRISEYVADHRGYRVKTTVRYPVFAR